MSDFDFVGDYDLEEDVVTTLPDNDAPSSLNCAFVGMGGGGGKIAAAFLGLGFNKTLMINTTSKDFSDGVGEEHLLALPSLDGVAKNVEMGKKALKSNSAIIEDALRTSFGAVDWLFVCASGGGGTGSSTVALDETFARYLESVEAKGRVVYIISRPTARELLNPTIKANYKSLLKDVSKKTYVMLDNERQLKRLRGRVGLSKMYPSANTMFAKMWSQVLNLTSLPSDVQACDGKDLGRFLSSPGRIMIGTALLQPGTELGANLYQKCVGASPCPEPEGKAKVGLLLEVMSEEMADSPEVSIHCESASAYVGGRSDTLFTGIYIYDMPDDLKERVVSIVALGGL